MTGATRRDDPLIDHLMELLAPLAATIGPLYARRMFGGHGLFHDGLMFGLVSGGQGYLRADEKTLPRFQAEGCEPFRHASKRGEVTMRHYLAMPPDCLESAETMTVWARLAIEAALRAANAAPSKRAPNARSSRAAAGPGSS